jgi:copper chaperone CopZ
MTDFAVTGMTCNTCRSKVETALKSIAPDAAVTLLPPRASVSGATLERVNATLAAVGNYRATLERPVIAAPSLFKTYYPFLLVMGLIAAVPLATGTWMGWMMGFMAGFYIVFGAFKLLDVPAFANAYARYDVIAKLWKPWGYIYPFVEVTLGFGFLFWFDMVTLSWIALILGVVGAVGVIQANLSKTSIQCACLGTVFQLPMSVITIIENVGMAAMAAYMLWMMA